MRTARHDGVLMAPERHVEGYAVALADGFLLPGLPGENVLTREQAQAIVTQRRAAGYIDAGMVVRVRASV